MSLSKIIRNQGLITKNKRKEILLLKEKLSGLISQIPEKLPDYWSKEGYRAVKLKKAEMLSTINEVLREL